MTLTDVLHIVLAVLVLGAATAFAAVVGFVSYGLLLSLVWVQLAALDVALTEVAIGSGLTGLLLLGAAAKLRPVEAQAGAGPGKLVRLLAALCCAAIAAALAAVILGWPAVGPTLAPETMAALPATGLGNPVTGVLMSFRAFDTLLEKAVLVLALVGVWSLAPDRYWGGRPAIRFPIADDGVLPFFARVLPPLGVLLAIHLMWTGADAPGGAFPGGTVLAAMWLIVIMAGLREAPDTSGFWLRVGMVSGPLVFLGVGFAGWLAAGAFLAYPVDYAKPLIILVEVPMLLMLGLVLGLLVAGPPEHVAASS